MTHIWVVATARGNGTGDADFVSRGYVRTRLRADRVELSGRAVTVFAGEIR